MKSKSIAYVAVFCALAVAITTLTHYVIPAKTVPLALVSLVGIMAFKMTGWGGGMSFVFVTGLLSFVFTGGLSITFFTLVVLFIPYTVLAHVLRKLKYTDKTAFIRGPIAYAYFFFSSFALMSLAMLVTGAESVLYVMQEKIGVWVASAIFAIACLPADFFLSSSAIIISDRISKTKKR